MGRIKNNFSLILRSTCHFLHGLDEAGICRRVVGEDNPSTLYLYFKSVFEDMFQNFKRMCV